MHIKEELSAKSDAPPWSTKGCCVWLLTVRIIFYAADSVGYVVHYVAMVGKNFLRTALRTVCSSSTWNPMEPYSTAAQQQSRDDCKNPMLPTNLCLLFPFLHTHQHNNKTECIVLPQNSYHTIKDDQGRRVQQQQQEKAVIVMTKQQPVILEKSLFAATPIYYTYMYTKHCTAASPCASHYGLD